MQWEWVQAGGLLEERRKHEQTATQLRVSKKDNGETGLATFEILVAQVETGLKEIENDCMMTALKNKTETSLEINNDRMLAALKGKKGV